MDPYEKILETKRLFMENLFLALGEPEEKELIKHLFNQLYDYTIKQVYINDAISRVIQAYCDTEKAIHIENRVKNEVASYQLDPKFLQMIQEDRKSFGNSIKSLESMVKNDVIGKMISYYDFFFNQCVLAINSIHCKKSILLDTLSKSEIEDFLVLFIDIVADKEEKVVIQSWNS